MRAGAGWRAGTEAWLPGLQRHAGSLSLRGPREFGRPPPAVRAFPPPSQLLVRVVLKNSEPGASPATVSTAREPPASNRK